MMKQKWNVSGLVTLVLGATALTACTDDAMKNDTKPDVPEVSITAGFEQTRLEYTQNGSAINLAWIATDSLAVFGTTGSSIFTTNETDAPSGTFSGPDVGTVTSAFYPSPESVTTRDALVLDMSGQLQVGNGTTDYLGGALYMDGVANGDGSLTFNPLVSVIKFKLTVPTAYGTINKMSFSTAKDVFVKKATVDGVVLEKTNLLELTTWKKDEKNLPQTGEMTVYLAVYPFDIVGQDLIIRMSTWGSKINATSSGGGCNVHNLICKIPAVNLSLSAGQQISATFDVDETINYTFKPIDGVTANEPYVYTEPDYTADTWMVNISDWTGAQAVVDFNTDSYLSGVKQVTANTFKDNATLTSIALSNNLEQIGARAFLNCTALESVTVPDYTYFIDNWAFENCTSLQSFDVPNKVTRIGMHAFFNNTALTSVSMPNTVTEIGGAAFASCTSLTNVTLPESLTVLGDSAFAGCTNLGAITIPAGITKINNNTFKNAGVSGTLTIPGTCVTVGGNNFWGSAIPLEHVVLEEGVKVVNWSTFRDMKQLVSIDFPSTITQLDNNVLTGASKKLETVIFRFDPRNVAGGANLMVWMSCSTCKIYIPDACFDAWFPSGTAAVTTDNTPWYVAASNQGRPLASQYHKLSELSQ